MKFINLKYPRSRDSQGGSIVIYTILILLVVITVAIALMRLILPKFKIVRESVYSVDALYAADSAAEWCLYNHNKVGSPPILEPGAVFYGNLDEGAGLVANDSSGNNNNGSLVNGTSWTSGKWGSGLLFDGINDAVSCTDANCGGTSAGKLDLGPAEDLTVAFWVNPRSYRIDYSGIISKLSNYGWAIGIAPNIIGSAIVTPAGQFTSPANGAVVPLGVWSHIAVVFDRDGYMTRYFNGAPTGTNQLISSLNGSSADSNGNFCISGRYAGTGCTDRVFDGYVDEVRIFKRALSAGEIQAMVQSSPILTMGNGATYQAYSPANSSTSTSCTESSFDYRLVGTYRDITRSLEIFE